MIYSFLLKIQKFCRLKGRNVERGRRRTRRRRSRRRRRRRRRVKEMSYSLSVAKRVRERRPLGLNFAQWAGANKTFYSDDGWDRRNNNRNKFIFYVGCKLS